MPEIAVKKVVLSQIAEDLKSGLTKWKKDDIGFGSLEKKYNLQLNEMLELLSHPKIKNLETKIPTFMIVDDLAEETPVTTTIEVAQPVAVQEPVKADTQKTTIVVKTEVKKERKSEPFI